MWSLLRQGIWLWKWGDLSLDKQLISDAIISVSNILILVIVVFILFYVFKYIKNRNSKKWEQTLVCFYFQDSYMDEISK